MNLTQTLTTAIEKYGKDGRAYQVEFPPGYPMLTVFDEDGYILEVFTWLEDALQH